MRILVAALLVLIACSPRDAGSDRHEETQGEVAESTPDTDTDGTRAAPRDQLVRNTYDVAHDVCGHDPDAIYQEAGSRNVHDAAEWYSKEMSQEGAHRAASYRGCGDALLGKEKNF